MSAFIVPGNLADRLREFQSNSRGGMPTLPKGMIKSIKVKTIHMGYKKRLNSIGNASARDTYFDCEEFGGRISVEQYFLKSEYFILCAPDRYFIVNLEHKRKLKYPTDLPVADLASPGKRANWVPAELCMIEPGSVYRGKLSDRETATMIKYACNVPRVNADAIVQQGFPSLGLAPLESPITGFGMAVDTNMSNIPGRELPPPRLTYKTGQARAQNGSWNILEVKFHRGTNIASWWVFVIKDGKNIIQGPDDPRLRGLVAGFKNKLAASGMAVPSALPRLLPPAILPSPHQDPERLNALNIIRQIFITALGQGPKPSFILVLLENRDNFIYPGIKVFSFCLCVTCVALIRLKLEDRRCRDGLEHYTYAARKGSERPQETRSVLLKCRFESEHKVGWSQSSGTVKTILVRV